MKLTRAFATKAITLIIVNGVFYGGTRIDWPRPAIITMSIIATIGLAGLGHFFVYWTRTLNDDIPMVGRILRFVAWSGALAAASIWMVSAPHIGILAGAFLLYMAGDAWREKVEKLFRRIRLEHVALPYDHPDYRPARPRPRSKPTRRVVR